MNNKPDKNQRQTSDISRREKRILEFWRKNKIFEKTLEKPSPRGEFVFYDGPPFATGLPHYGSLLSSIVKDVVPRYKTMRGYHVRRRWGWDCHGLPIENAIEKELGLTSKKDIERIGVKTFNEVCRASILRYVDEWKEYIDRIGRWVDYDNSYKTMDATYMESVWWALKEMHKKKLLYEGRKVLLYCSHCETPLAKAEVQMDNSYRDVTEESVTVKFKVQNPEKLGLEGDVYLLAWTTTPWTLPGNVALAVGKDIEYVVVKYPASKKLKTEDFPVKDAPVAGDSWFVLAKNLSDKIFGESVYKVEREYIWNDLVGLEYEPLYDIDAVKKTDKRAWYVTDGDFVNTDEGTGIVHTAVIYGEDDYGLGLRGDLPMVPLLDESGVFNQKAPGLVRGTYFKDSEKMILKDLENRNLVFSTEQHTHSYPHCHRCDTPLYYNAITSWFINIQKVKRRLLRLNEKVSWYPEHLKHGRFLNILKSAPDWTISRNRYWASPLPIWKCEECDKFDVIGSVEELKQHTKRSGNSYTFVRHGESESNKTIVVSDDPEAPDRLTKKGRQQVEVAVKSIHKGDFDIIVSSPYVRTRETAEIFARHLGFTNSQVLFDKRIGELTPGDEFSRKSWNLYNKKFSLEAQFERSGKNGESRMDVKRRAGEFLYDLEHTYTNKKILIVSHEATMDGLWTSALGSDKKNTIKISHGIFHKNADLIKLDFVPLPHNDNYELDLHRPYIDDVKLGCVCGKTMSRIPEVVDGWFEAGSMPFAEYHYPFENRRTFKKRFPSDFVTEYIAQTRTWYYYMHAVSGIIFRKPSFKNVLSTGNILSEDGTKMSKSKKNYTDPFGNLDRYGADSLRYYLMTSVVMQAEDLRFTDLDLQEVHNRLINILWNTFKFYDTYKGQYDGSTEVYKSDNVLDRWILSRLSKLNTEITEHLEKFDTVKAGRPIRDFVTDLSTWYVRRSRDRFKGDDDNDRPSDAKAMEDKQYALATLEHVLLELSKIIAPFMPFLAEDVYKRIGGKLESVHLESWPSAGRVNGRLLKDMTEVRDIVSLALEARATAGIKVRQPLASLKIRNPNSEIQNNEELMQLIKDEVNVKDVVFEDGTGLKVELDRNITPELKAEGDARELTRQIQSLRKEMGLTPSDTATLRVATDASGKNLIEKFGDQIKRTALLENITFGNSTEGKKVNIEDIQFTVGLTKS